MSAFDPKQRSNFDAEVRLEAHVKRDMGVSEVCVLSFASKLRRMTSGARLTEPSAGWRRGAS